MAKIDDNNIREDLRIGKVPERDANLNNRARTKANPHESRGRKAAGLKRRTPDVRDAMTAGPLYTVVMKDGTCPGARLPFWRGVPDHPGRVTRFRRHHEQTGCGAGGNLGEGRQGGGRRSEGVKGFLDVPGENARRRSHGLDRSVARRTGTALGIHPSSVRQRVRRVLPGVLSFRIGADLFRDAGRIANATRPIPVASGILDLVVRWHSLTGTTPHEHLGSAGFIFFWNTGPKSQICTGMFFLFWW